MNGSIGAALASFADLSVQRTLGAAGATPGRPAAGNPTSFGAQLEQSFQARAEHLGLHLPSTTAPDAQAGVQPEGVDAIWKRAQMQALASGNGPGDAMMQSLSDAADARWNQRHLRQGSDLFDI